MINPCTATKRYAICDMSNTYEQTPETSYVTHFFDSMSYQVATMHGSWLGPLLVDGEVRVALEICEDM